MSAVLALFSLACADSRMFLAPMGYNPQMAQPRDASAYGPAAGPYLQTSEPGLPAEPIVPMQVAYPSKQEAPAASSSVVYAAAGAILIAGAALAANRKETAVAAPDLEAAESAATVAMLLTSGSKATPKKKAAAPKRKPAPKRAVKPAAKKAGGKGGVFTTAEKKSGVETFAKNFFTEENWAFQAFSILKDLPKNNEKPRRR